MAAANIQTVYASAARTATPTAVDLDMDRARGLVLVIDVTAISLTPSVVVNVDGFDPLSGQQWTLLDSAAITAVSTTVLKIGPALTAAANAVANDIIPAIVRVEPVHADADSITYSISAHTTD